MELNAEIAKKVLSVVDAGLVQGMGKQIPGKMCVEAAVCFALGLPHGDNPPCVGSSVRAYKIRLNDADWSSDEARSKGMRRVAIAQLGSDEVDQRAFREEIVLLITRQILPIAMRAAGSISPEYKEALEAAAVVCEIAADPVAGRAAVRTAREVTMKCRPAVYAAYVATAAKPAAYAAYAAAAYAADAADAAGAYAVDAVDAYAAAAATAYAAADAAAAAAYAADAYADAVADAYVAARDRVFCQTAEIAVEALIKLGSKGCEWLYLCDEPI